MYLGSCGYAYVWHRVLKFLRHDATASATLGESSLFSIAEAQAFLDKAIAYNAEVLASDAKKRFEQNTNSFFMAASVGFYTMLILEKMEQIPPEVEEGKDLQADLREETLAQVAKQVMTHIVPAHIFSMQPTAEVEVLYGTPGYMFSLISILEKLEPWRGRHPVIDEACKAATMALTTVTLKLVQQTTFKAPNGEILVVEFPKGKKKYIGGAHGIFGEV